MKRILTLALIVVAMLALAAAPALAEGYNDSGYNYSVDGDASADLGDAYDYNAGYYTRANGYTSGPHGGYNSTTNKCQECHSTHYAAGSYMLLRASTREAACDFCHVGGGGSSINIQMDNAYTATGVTSEDGEGMGTGHTLGYTGLAPVDIKPAYSDSEGLACFDCHTPHGNSARVLTTFANPGRAMEPTTAVTAVFAKFGSVPVDDATLAAAGIVPNLAGNYVLDASKGATLTADKAAYWGMTPNEGNIVLLTDVSSPTGAADGIITAVTKKKPIWPTGRFLLLKNPDNGDGEDTRFTTDAQVAGEGPFEGYNKLAIDWDDPYGPADPNYGGDQNNDYDKALPWNPKPVGMGGTAEFGDDNTGMLAVSEFCTDCHDGAAGASVQGAVVALEHTSTYVTAYSHDAQPRH